MLTVFLYNRDLDNPELLSIIKDPQDLTFKTGSPGGFLECNFSWSCSTSEALDWYQEGHFRRVVVTDETGYTAYEGRIESVKIKIDGITLRAAGYYRNTTDTPYKQWFSSERNGIATWSVTQQVWYNEDGWTWTHSGAAMNRPEWTQTATHWKCTFEADPPAYHDWSGLQMHLQWPYFGIIKGVRFTHSVDNDQGTNLSLFAINANTTFSGEEPDGGMPQNNYEFLWSTGFSSVGDVQLTVSGDNFTNLYWRFATDNAWDEEAWSIHSFENLDVRTTAGERTVPNLIGDIVSKSCFQLREDFTKISRESEYEMPFPAEFDSNDYPMGVINNITKLGTLDRRVLNFYVWEDRIPVLEIEHSVPDWYAFRSDMEGELSLERTVDELWNAVYTSYYSDRTAVSYDFASIDRWGFTPTNCRLKAIPVGGWNYGINNQGDVGYWEGDPVTALRDLELRESKDPRQQAQFTLKNVRDVNGNIHPIYKVRAGDVVQIVDMFPDTASLSDVDSYRNVTIRETQYDHGKKTLNASVGRGLRTLDLLTARIARLVSLK